MRIIDPVFCNRFAGFTFSSNVLLNARLDQWPGMVLSSFVGYVVSQVFSSHIDQGTGDCIAAFAVGLTGLFYSLQTITTVQFCYRLPKVARNHI